MELKFKVKNQIMTLRTNAQPVDGSMNYLKLSFMFSEDWTGLAKQIIFFYEDENSTYDMVDDAIIVPEYYTAHDYFNFTVVGREQDTLRITTNLTTVTLLESGYMGTGDEPAPPEDVYTAIMQKLMDITNNMVGTVSAVGKDNELFNDADSHVVEGDDTTVNNHLEGKNNKVIKAHATYNNMDNHLEGSFNIAGGEAGHLEGSHNQTYETRGHTGGIHSVSSGSGAFAHGRGVIAFGVATVSTGQSAYKDNVNDTTVLGVDGEETDIDWTTREGESEGDRAARISQRLEGLYLGTALKSDGSVNESVKYQFTAAVGPGAEAGGVNCFTGAGSSWSHGFKCWVLAQFGCASGHFCRVGKGADGSFVHGYNLEALAPYTTTFGLSNVNRAKNAFMVGENNTNTTNAENSFTGGKNSQSQNANVFTWGLNCYVAAPWSIGMGRGIVVGSEGQIVFGRWNNNESSAIFCIGVGDSASDRMNGFEVYKDRVCIPSTSHYEGEGGSLKTTFKYYGVTSAAVSPTFRVFTNSDVGTTVTTNTALPANPLSNAVADNNYQNKNYWHNNYDVVDGNPVPNPVLTIANPYTISFVVNSDMYKAVNETHKIVLRFYPRQETGDVRPGTIPTSCGLSVKGKSERIYVNLTVDDYTRQSDEYGYYKDFILDYNQTLYGTDIIEFNIKKVPGADATYPQGQFVCAQGIRLGWCAYTKPITPKYTKIETVADIAQRVNSMHEGAYYSNDQLIGLIKSFISTATDKTPGVMKLYNDHSGSNTDGTMTQKAIWQEISTLSNITQRKPTIISNIRDNYVWLENLRTVYAISTSIDTLELQGRPYGDGTFCRLCFRSGETATVLQMPSDQYAKNYVLVWRGDDCETGVLVPQANKIYQVDFTCIGDLDPSYSTKYMTVAEVSSYDIPTI